ncbi:MAG TPA: hypothetical protein VFE15_02185 [Marmoricola sp.]|jgi:hypothetical protein|nr:hypothetical protein [Marmoricola sp.]
MHAVRRRRIAPWVVALLLPLGGLLAIAPAHADTPGPTTLDLAFTGGDHAGEVVTASADVRPADNSSDDPTGSVTFSVGDGQPVPVDQELDAQTTFVLTSNDPVVVTATFHGTGGWGDSTVTSTFHPLYKFTMVADPTIASVGAGGLKLNLTLSLHVVNSIGQGVPGYKVAFTLLQPTPNVVFQNKLSLPVCTAVSDANGLATCGGTGLVAAVVSILVDGAYGTVIATPTQPLAGLDSTHLPVVTFVH